MNPPLPPPPLIPQPEGEAPAAGDEEEAQPPAVEEVVAEGADGPALNYFAVNVGRGRRGRGVRVRAGRRGVRGSRGMVMRGGRVRSRTRGGRRGASRAVRRVLRTFAVFGARGPSPPPVDPYQPPMEGQYVMPPFLVELANNARLIELRRHQNPSGDSGGLFWVPFDQGVEPAQQVHDPDEAGPGAEAQEEDPPAL